MNQAAINHHRTRNHAGSILGVSKGHQHRGQKAGPKPQVVVVETDQALTIDWNIASPWIHNGFTTWVCAKIGGTPKPLGFPFKRIIVCGSLVTLNFDRNP